jgi:large subunit ribosomal protein L24
MSKWIKKEDKVLIISGNDKGKTGQVLARKGDRVVVQGANMRKRHLKRKSQTIGPQILDIETSIHISNVCLCDEQGNRLKLKLRVNGEGSRELYYIKSGEQIVYRKLGQ